MWVRQLRSFWSAHSGRSFLGLSSPWPSWQGVTLIFALISFLCLLSSPLSAQNMPPTSPLGASDYLTFQDDSATVRLQLSAYKTALTQALAEKQTIEQNLADATKKYNDLVASATQHSGDSTQSLEALSAEVKRLTEQLKESKASVDELQSSLESKQKEYDQKLKDATAKAKSLETWNTVLWIVAAIFGIETIYIVFHALGWLP